MCFPNLRHRFDLVAILNLLKDLQEQHLFSDRLQLGPLLGLLLLLLGVLLLLLLLLQQNYYYYHTPTAVTASTINYCYCCYNDRAQELCESRGGRPGLPSLINLRFLWM